LDDLPASRADQQSRQGNLPHRDRPQPAHGFTISRADLASCMLTLLGDPAIVHRHVSVAS